MKKDSRKSPREWEFSSVSLSYGKANVKIELQQHRLREVLLGFEVQRGPYCNL